MLIGPNLPYLSPVDVINTRTHYLTLTRPRHVKGMSPPSVAENKQIILSGDSRSFKHDGDGASSLSLSPYVCLALTHSHSIPVSLQ